jgi:DNA-binding SARP family transcriptional activator
MRAIVQEGNDYARLDGWAERVESMLAAEPACPEPLLGMAAVGMLSAFAFRRIDQARKRYWAERVMTLASNSGDLSFRFMTGGALAMYFVFHDDPARVAVISDMLRAAARGAKLPDLATLSQLEVSGLVTWIAGDNRAALAVVREALALAARTGVFMWNDHLSHLGATAALAMEDVDAAHEFLGLLAESAQRGGAFASGGYQFYASWESMLRGDHGRALHFMQLATTTGDGLDYPFAQALNGFGSAQIEWQLGRQDKAKQSLVLARQRAREADSPLVLHACDLLDSDFLWEEERERALDCLRRGLALARERGYFNGFWLRRSWMARVLMRALDHGIETEHVRAYIMKHHLSPERVPPRVESWPWRHRIRALGAFEHTQESAPATSPTGGAGVRTNLRGMPLRLLQAIVSFGARAVRETDLIDALWPDADGDAGRRVLDTTLHRLRRQLGDDEVIHVSDGRIFLDSRLCWVDVWAFEDLIAEADRAMSTRARPEVLEDVASRLLRVYRGPLLGDEAAAGGWALGPRERLSDKFLRVADLLGRALETAGRAMDAATMYRRVLEEHPLAETFCAGSMRCDVAAGYAANAVQTFERYRARLAESQNVEPGSEIARLYAQLTRPSPQERARPS